MTDDIIWDDETPPAPKASAPAAPASNIIWDDEKAAPLPPPDTYGRQVAAAARGVTQAIPFAKDIGAALDVARTYLGDQVAGVPSTGSFGERYAPAQRRQKALNESLSAQYPKTMLAGNVAGALALPVAGPASAIAARAAPVVGRGVASALGAGTVGAGYGAAYGAGEGDTLAERLHNAETGAAVGGIGGAAVGPIVDKTLSPLARWAATKLGRTPPVAPIPDKQELFDKAHQAYLNSEQKGVMVRPDAVRSLYDDIARDLAGKGYHPKNTPELQAALGELYKASIPAMNGQPNYTTLKGLDIINQMARNASTSPNPQSRLMGGIFHNKLDDFLDTLGPSNTIGGNAPEAVEALNAGRELWRSARKTETIENLVDDALMRTSSTGSGGNINNALRQELRKVIVQARKKPGRWTDDELDAMRSIVDGTPTQNAARLLGKLSPSGNGLMAALELGAVAHNPAALPAPLIGMLSKAYADKATRAGVHDLQELIRSGGSRAAMPQAAPLPQLPTAKTLGITGFAEPMFGAQQQEQPAYRAAGGRVDRRDYPAKPLSKLEKAARRAHLDIAKELEPVMNMPDDAVANALSIANRG